jgi:5-methylcytosine-specific restriction endonuclease McrA
MPQRTCGVDGCPKPHRARGLCVTHYNRQYPAPGERHRKLAVPCAWCGAECMKATTQRYERRFCSLHCRDTWRRRHLLPVLFVGEVLRPEPGNKVTPPTRPRLWVAGRCRRCTTPFVDRQPDARFCSKRCGRQYWRDQRKDEVPHATRLHVLERDGWRCQICRRGIPASLTVPHPRAGTADHVIPRSQGGSHDLANLRAAHFLCNARRGNRGGNEQLALIG